MESQGHPGRDPAQGCRDGGRLSTLARRPVFWAGLLLLGLPFVLYWPVWWPDEAVRRSFAFGDFVEQYYPMRAFVAGEWRAGRLPLWDPYTYSGTPAAAASLFAAFYPFGLWLALFPPPFPFMALQIEAILHLGLGGVFTLLFVRRLTGSTGAGLLAGLAFSLGGFLTSYPLLQLGILETAIWLPLGLWLMEGGLGERDLRRAALAGLAFACALLAGHPQTFLYIAYLAGAYFVFRAARLRVPLKQVALLAVVTGATTVMVSAVQWLPSLELARLSPRAALSYDAVSNGFTPRELWGLLRPNPGEWSPLFVGWIPLALAVLGVARRRGEAWFWLAVAAVAALLALGRNGFLYPLAHGVMPGMASFRNQERAALLVSFSLAVLAGYGYAAVVRPGLMRISRRAAGRNDGWVAKKHPDMGRPDAGRPDINDRAETGVERRGGILGAALFGPDVNDQAGIGFRTAKVREDTRDSRGLLVRLFVVLLAGLTFADLYRTSYGLALGPAGGEPYFPKTGITEHLRVTGSADWRTSSEGLLPGDGNAGQVYRVRDVTGNSPLHLAHYDRFLDQVPEARFWQLLNVQHLVTRRDVQHGAALPVMEEADVRLYQIFGAQPAWIVHDYRLAGDVDEAIDLTAREALDPLGTAVLEQEPGLALTPASGNEEAKLVDFGPQRVVVDASLSAPGIVVSSEVSYPGWVARVNGGGAETLRVYGLLRGVALPAGQWRIEWRYEPVTVYAGLALALGGLALTAGLLGVGRRRSRYKSKVTYVQA